MDVDTYIRNHVIEHLGFDPEENSRRWNSEFGLPFEPFCYLYRRYDRDFEHPLSSTLPYFHFLKNNATYDGMKIRFQHSYGLTNNDVCHSLVSTREWLASDLHEIRWSDRFNAPFSTDDADPRQIQYVSTCLDGVPMFLPKYPFNTSEYRDFWAAKYQRHCKKYIGAIALGGAKNGFIWFSRHGAKGNHSEQRILRESELPSLLREGRQLESGLRVSELAFGDRLFQGEAGVLSPYKGQLNDNKKAFNAIVNTERVLIENAFARMKKYHVCEIWRGDRSDLDDTTWILANLTNIDIRFFPLRIDND